jgi:hypothetical protein
MVKLQIALPAALALALTLACASFAPRDVPSDAIKPTFTPTAIPPTVEPLITLPTVEPTLVPILAATVEPVAPTDPPQPVQDRATANDVANLRSGPGTDFAIVNSVPAGEPLVIVGRNAGGDWYQLSGGTWIAAFLVTDAPLDVAVIDTPVIEQPAVAPVVALPTDKPIAAATEVPAAAPSNDSPFTCAGGCATAPDPSCSIKGNVNSNGERIFHTIGDSTYGRTDIKPEEGDRWFCTIQEALDAGFRAPEN